MTKQTSLSRLRRAVPAAGLLLALLGGCTIGIDDHPVPPELIPNATASITAPADYGAPVGEVSAMPLPAPETAGGSSAQEGTGLVWRTGAQPVRTGEAGLAVPAPGSESADAVSEEPAAEPQEPVEAAADEAAEPARPEAETAALEEPPSGPASSPRTFRLASYVGIDATEAEPLTAALRSETAAQQIGLNGGSGSLILKGYLSSYPKGGQTVIVYVWDVYDPSGLRLLRIDGQEKALMPPDAGWSSLPPETLRTIARTTARRLGEWAQKRTA